MRTLLGLILLAMTAPLFAQPVPDLFWFRFEETSGTSSTNQGTLAGSMFGGFTVTTAGVFTDGVTAATPTRVQPGAVGTGAVNLSTPSVWLDTGLPGTTLNSSSFTVECWINTGGVSQEGNVIFSICTNSGLDLSLYVASPSNLLAMQTAGGIVGTGATNTVNDGNWHHVALVYDRGAQTLTTYRDGVQEGQATGQNLTFTAGSNVVYFNGRTTTNFGRWAGRADEARFHSSVIAPANFADTYAPVAPGGGGGGGGGDEGGCSTGAGRAWAIAALPALLLLRLRRRKAQA